VKNLPTRREVVAGRGPWQFGFGALRGITNCTFSGNSAAVGADIVTEPSASVVNNSIFANSSSGGNCDGIGDDGYNISDDGFRGTSVIWIPSRYGL